MYSNCATMDREGRKEKKILAHLFVILILDLLAFTCILPLFPALMEFYASRSKPEDTYAFFDNHLHRFRSLIGAPNERRLNSVFFGGNTLQDIPAEHHPVYLVPCSVFCSFFLLLLWALFRIFSVESVFYCSPCIDGSTTYNIYVDGNVSLSVLCRIAVSYSRKISFTFDWKDTFRFVDTDAGILLESFARMVGTLASFLVWSRASTFDAFIASRIIGGLSKASVSVATAVVADVMAEGNRGKGMALIGIAFSTGFIFGPLIGAYFAVQARRGSSDFYVTPAYFAVALTAIELGWIALFMPETLADEKREGDLRRVVRQATSYINPRALFGFKQLRLTDEMEGKMKLSTLRQIGLIYFLYLLIYSGLEFTLSFLTHLRFGYDSMQQGKMYFFCGFIMILLQGTYVRRIPSEKQQAAAQLGFFFIIPSFLLIGFAQNAWLLYTGLALYATASSLVVTCLTTMVSSFGNDSEKGTIMGIFRALGALARAIGPLLVSSGFWLLGPTAAYAGGAVLLFIPYALLRQLRLNPPTR